MPIWNENIQKTILSAPSDTTNMFAITQNLLLDVYSFNADTNVTFKAMLTTFSDNFNTSAQPEVLVGHPEPLRKIKTVERVVSVGFDLPAFSKAEAKANLKRIKLLVSMLYPSVQSTSGTSQYGIPQKYVKAGGDPLFKIGFKNLLSKEVGVGGGTAKDFGLTGYIDNLNYDFALDSSFVNGPSLQESIRLEGAGAIPPSPSFIYPKLVRVNFVFYPLHTITPGWEKTGEDGKPEFKYGDNIPYGSEEGQTERLENLSPAGQSTENLSLAGQNIRSAMGVNTAGWNEGWMGIGLGPGYGRSGGGSE